jgi:branched-chain amino acid transport system substrate-binding protein
MLRSGLGISAVSTALLIAIMGAGLSASPSRAEDVIRFGAPQPLTGPLAPEGI